MGSHIADELSNTGKKVVLMDKICSAHQTENQEMVIGDVLDIKKLIRIMKHIDVVYHLAALADINITWNNPRETIKVNILGTTNVLEAARLCGVKCIVFASTLYAESHTGGLYRVSKHTGEQLCEAYYKYCGLNYIILRFGTLYGPRSNQSNSIYRLIKEALTTGKIEYKGTGNEVREYIHVKDAARICANLSEKDYGSTLLLTGYHRFKLTEILDMINEILQKKIKINYHPEDNRAHYEQVPYHFKSSSPKRVVSDTYHDLGASLMEIMEEIWREKQSSL